MKENKHTIVTSEGQLFNGWYTDVTGGTVVSFDLVENATSYAVLADGVSIGEVGI